MKPFFLSRVVVSALLRNIRLSWKGFPGTNKLAYYKRLLIAVIISFIIMGKVLLSWLSRKNQVQAIHLILPLSMIHKNR